MEIDFPGLLDDLKKDIRALARKTLTLKVKEAREAAEYIVDKCSLNLERWTKELAEGSMNRDDFDYHVKSQKDLLKLVALKQAGIAQLAIDDFKDEVFLIISRGILKAIGL